MMVLKPRGCEYFAKALTLSPATILNKIQFVEHGSQFVTAPGCWTRKMRPNHGPQACRGHVNYGSV